MQLKVEQIIKVLRYISFSILNSQKSTKNKSNVLNIASILNTCSNSRGNTLNQLSKSQNDLLRQSIHHQHYINGPSQTPYISNDVSAKNVKSMEFEAHRRALEKTVHSSRSLAPLPQARKHVPKVRPHDSRPQMQNKQRGKFVKPASKCTTSSQKLGDRYKTNYENRQNKALKRTFCEMNGGHDNSRSHKYVKVSDTAAQKSKTDSKSSVPNVENLDNKTQYNSDKVYNEFYNMSRLDLGLSIDSLEGQHELKSRLKAITNSNKVLTEDTAIVVPCLPLILYPQKP